MIRGGTSRQLNCRYSETPDVCLKVVACHLIGKEKYQIKKTLIYPVCPTIFTWINFHGFCKIEHCGQ